MSDEHLIQSKPVGFAHEGSNPSPSDDKLKYISFRIIVYKTIGGHKKDFFYGGIQRILMKDDKSFV